jgi:hypothetical protein
MALKGFLRLGTSALSLLIGLMPFYRANAQPAGSVGAVNPSATGAPPGGAPRSLAIGTSIVRNERLQTSATGTLHVTFNDRTTLNLGPNTNLVVDQYVYNPASGAASLQTSVRSGLVRFVGGQSSHQGNASIQTPVATIGIRGNMVVVQFDPTCGWRVTSLAQGVITVRNRVSEVRIERPGFTVCVAAADQIIPQPTRADPGMVAQAFAATLSRPGQTGGAIRLPTDTQASRHGLGSSPLPSRSGSALDYQSILSIQQEFGRNAAQARQPGRAVPEQQNTTPPGEPNPYGNAQ